MDVGLELRQARERRGLSLLQLSKITKIGLRRLQAIEDSDEHNLPATVFTRSFVKSYAAEVGLDPDETWRRFAEQFEPADASGDDTAVPEPATRAPSLATELWPRARVLYGRFGTGAVLILVSVVVVGLAGRNAQRSPSDGGQPGDASRSTSPAVSAAGFVPASSVRPAPVGTSGTTPAPANALRLAINPTGPCWMQATVGDQRVLASLLAAGDRRTIDSPSEVTLRIGDPTTCAFSINGTPARIPGTAGKAVTIRITNENYRQFLAQ